MDFPVSREEFLLRHRVGRRQGYLWLLAGLVPCLVYWAPLFIWKRDLIPGLSSTASTILFTCVLVWMLAVALYYQQVILKKLGLSCSDCGKKYIGQSYEIVMASGRCGGCGKKVLNDVP
jgi:DNA-directed RNA polymerase subunit RPC12/RpoP